MFHVFKIILLFLSINGRSQVVDFEKLPNLKPGDPVGVITLEEEDYNIQFYIGHSIEDTIPLKFEKVAHHSGSGGFYGPESHLDCEGKVIETERINQINDKNFILNPELTNRERVGCHFISGILLGEVLPSIFIFYDKPVKGCSADLLDVDGHNNTIEAYDIYCYASTAYYPLKPINNKPIEIRAVGRTFGSGIQGDNGGVMPFDIDFVVEFSLVEIRPIQQVSGGNDVRNEFGFALDNYSPKSVEQAPYIPPYMTQEENPISVATLSEKSVKPFLQPSSEAVNETLIQDAILPQNESVYFDFDSHSLTHDSEQVLDELIAALNEKKMSAGVSNQFIYLSGFTDSKGSEAYNEELSKKRVDAVAAYLIQHGIDTALIKRSHYGEKYKGDSGDTDHKKRTVKIVLK